MPLAFDLALLERQMREQPATAISNVQVLLDLLAEEQRACVELRARNALAVAALRGALLSVSPPPADLLGGLTTDVLSALLEADGRTLATALEKARHGAACYQELREAVRTFCAAVEVCNGILDAEQALFRKLDELEA